MLTAWSNAVRNACLTRHGVRYLTLPASKFASVLCERTNTTADAFKGVPLSTLNPTVRGDILADLAQQVDAEVNTRATFDQIVDGKCRNGSRRGRNQMECDWLRDGLRIECKSAKMSWLSSKRCWHFQFSHIKIASSEVRRVAAFDELLLVLYTPTHIYFYRHDGKFGLSSVGQRTATAGHQLWIRGGGDVKEWHLALNNILGKLDDNSNSCSLLSVMPLTDNRIQCALDRRCDVTQRIFQDCPLSQVSPSARGKRLEVLVRRVDHAVNPHAEITLPDPGRCSDGLKQRGANRATCDWHRDGIRIECKSSQLQWDKYWRRWFFCFQNVKVKIAGPGWFDELLLAFYTPSGVYIYRHDLLFGLSSRGVSTEVDGHSIKVYGPCREADWTVALSAILRKIGESNCERIAFVRW